MSIRWIKNVIIDNEKTTLEVQLGNKKIGDKCYIRIGNEMETYFQNLFYTRDEILAQAKDLLKKRLRNNAITYPDGKPYDWNS